MTTHNQQKASKKEKQEALVNMIYEQGVITKKELNEMKKYNKKELKKIIEALDKNGINTDGFMDDLFSQDIKIKELMDKDELKKYLKK